MALKITHKPAPGGVLLEMDGVIDEQADFGEAPDGAKVLILDFERVTRVNSYGVKKWLLAVRKFSANATIHYRRCRTCIIEQINIISDLQKTARVDSFYLPFGCECREDEVHKLVSFEEASKPNFIDNLNKLYPCEKCDRHLEFADDESLYFDFLTR